MAKTADSSEQAAVSDDKLAKLAERFRAYAIVVSGRTGQSHVEAPALVPIDRAETLCRQTLLDDWEYGTWPPRCPGCIRAMEKEMTASES